MFEHSIENPSKIVCQNLLNPIEPKSIGDVWIWTPGLQAYSDVKTVYLLFTYNENVERKVIRIYPLEPDPAKAPAVNVIVPKDHFFYTEADTYHSHIAYEHIHFAIVRPMMVILQKAVWSWEHRQDDEYLYRSILTALKHAHHYNIISDEMVINFVADFNNNKDDENLLQVAEDCLNRLKKILL